MRRLKIGQWILGLRTSSRDIDDMFVNELSQVYVNYHQYLIKSQASHIDNAVITPYVRHHIFSEFTKIGNMSIKFWSSRVCNINPVWPINVFVMHYWYTSYLIWNNLWRLLAKWSRYNYKLVTCKEIIVVFVVFSKRKTCVCNNLNTIRLVSFDYLKNRLVVYKFLIK